LLVDVVRVTGVNRRLLDIPLFERGKQQRLKFESPEPLQEVGAQLQLSFKDVLGKIYHITYAVQREADEPRSLLLFTKIEQA
jgi:hypothetical protein